MLKSKITGGWYWLIAKRATSKMDVLSVRVDSGGEALAIFSFEEEAKMFLDLRLAASEEGWCVRQTSIGEVVSVLYGPCSDAKKVVLDPVPEVGKKELVELLNMHRNDFLRFLLGDGPSNLRLVPSPAQRPQKRVERGCVA
jgi:hypothetical protein